MEDPPLASLSLTHVHYVRLPAASIYAGWDKAAN